VGPVYRSVKRIVQEVGARSCQAEEGKCGNRAQEDAPVKEDTCRRRRHEDQEVLNPLAGTGESDQPGSQRMRPRWRSWWGLWSIHCFGRDAQGVVTVCLQWSRPAIVFCHPRAS
jgi:hypothetical protein